MPIREISISIGVQLEAPPAATTIGIFRSKFATFYFPEGFAAITAADLNQ